MNNTESARHGIAHVIGWAVFIMSGVALYLQVTEPFAGTRVGYAGRILGPVATMMIALSLVRRQRGRVLLWVGATMGATALLLVMAGRTR